MIFNILHKQLSRYTINFLPTILCCTAQPLPEAATLEAMKKAMKQEIYEWRESWYVKENFLPEFNEEELNQFLEDDMAMLSVHEKKTEDQDISPSRLHI